MPSVTVQHIRRKGGRADERTEVAGVLTTNGRQGSIPAGTFNLNAISAISFGQAHDPGSRVIGSVNSPNTLGNTIQALALVGPSTANGSVGSPGVDLDVPFIAYGY